MHLRSEAIEPTQTVEKRAAPEPNIGIAGQLVFKCAEREFWIGAIFVKIFLTMPSCSMRPKESAKPPVVHTNACHHEVCCKDERGTQREGHYAIANTGEWQAVWFDKPN